jgi:hypothetical protein
MNFFWKIYTFYRDGFRSMTIGRKLWIIILVKLFVIFVVLKLIFFPDFLKSSFSTDTERSNYVIKEITNTK